MASITHLLLNVEKCRSICLGKNRAQKICWRRIVTGNSYLSIESAASVHMEQFIVSHCHRFCTLHGMTPNGQLSSSSSYASTQTVLSISPMSATARDPTNSWVPTWDRLRRQTSTTSTVRLPIVPTTKRIQCTTAVTYSDQLKPDENTRDDQLPGVVASVEFQPFVSSREPLAFAKDRWLVTFILLECTCRVGYPRYGTLFCVGQQRLLCALCALVLWENWWILICLLLLVASCRRL